MSSSNSSMQHSSRGLKAFAIVMSIFLVAALVFGLLFIGKTTNGFTEMPSFDEEEELEDSSSDSIESNPLDGFSYLCSFGIDFTQLSFSDSIAHAIIEGGFCPLFTDGDFTVISYFDYLLECEISSGVLDTGCYGSGYSRYVSGISTNYFMLDFSSYDGFMFSVSVDFCTSSSCSTISVSDTSGFRDYLLYSVIYGTCSTSDFVLTHSYVCSSDVYYIFWDSPVLIYSISVDVYA